MPARVIVTAGPVADCTQAGALVEGMGAESLMADRGCGSGAIVGMATEAGMAPAIPPRPNRREKRRHDRYLYRLRHLVENAFAEMRRWRGIATRYAKSAASCLAAARIIPTCVL
jgi:transposase